MSVVNTAIAQIATQWEALTPPDRAAVRYHEVDGRKSSLKGSSADRLFEFDLPVRQEPVGQSHSSTTVQWATTARVRLSQAGRSGQALRIAAADEAQALTRSVELTSTWPVGVVEVLTEAANPTQDSDRDDVTLEIGLLITTFEGS